MTAASWAKICSVRIMGRDPLVSQSQSYFTTVGLLPISSSWCQVPCDSSWAETFLQLISWGHSPYVTSSLTRRWICPYEYAWPFVKFTYRTYSILLKILPCALYTSPLSVQALQSRSCLSYVSYSTTAVGTWSFLVLARTAQKIPITTALLLLRACLFRPLSDGSFAIV
jgi:hypothetical protein